MLKTKFARAASATAVALGLTVGSLALAPAANAATSSTAHDVLPIVVGHHYDNFRIDRSTTHTLKLNGEKVYTHYTVTIKHGKKVLFKKNETVYQMYNTVLHLVQHNGGVFKTDAGLVSTTKKYSKVSNTAAKAYVIKVLKSLEVGAREASVKSDVRNTVDNVVTWLAVGPNAGTGTTGSTTTPGTTTGGTDTDAAWPPYLTTYGGTTVHSTGNKVTVKFLGDKDNNFIVIGLDVKDHYQFTYDSRTGEFHGKTVK